MRVSKFIIPIPPYFLVQATNISIYLIDFVFPYKFPYNNVNFILKSERPGWLNELGSWISWPLLQAYH